MNLQGLTALATLLLHLFSSVGGGLVYLCKIDGEVRLACCCEASDRQETEPPAVSSSQGCCDVLTLHASREPALAEQRPVAPLHAPLASWPALSSWLEQPEWARLDLPPVEDSPPGGPPLFLRNRTLLI